MTDLLLEGVATRLALGYDQAVPLLAQATRTWQPIASPAISLWFLFGHFAALDLMDFAALREWNRLGERHARPAGLPLTLRIVLLAQVSEAVLAGSFAKADSLSAESEELSSVIGVPESFRPLDFVEIYGARGLGAETRAAVRKLDVVERDTGFDAGLCTARVSLIRLSLGRCEYEEAVIAGQDLVEHPGFGTGALFFADVVEAAVRTGRPGTG